MEGDLYNIIQKQNEQAPIEPVHEVTQVPEFSFIPPELIKKEGGASAGLRDKCALGGVVFGGLALVSWIVILFGVLASVIGITLSVIGLKSNRQKHARIGLYLSVVGLIISLWYLFAVFHGTINYNYFTSEFWEVGSGVEAGVK